MTVRLTTLDNGFRIVTEPMPGLQSAAIGVWVLAGARHESARQNGIAHFLEHMAFKGTATRSALDIAEAIEDVGGYINAYTSREVTAYYARVLGEHVPLALDVVADILRNPVFDPSEIEIERGVILQEIGQAFDTPDDIIFDWLQEKAYPDHPLGRAILGDEARVQSFDRPDLTGFVSEHYRPGQMILSASGAVDHDALVAGAEKLFGDMKAESFLAQYRWNFMQALGLEFFTDRLFALSAGVIEVVFGIILVLGTTTRLNVLAFSVVLFSSNVLFLIQGENEAAMVEFIGHMPVIGVALILLLLGAGQRLKVTNFLPQRRVNNATKTVSVPADV